MFSSLTMTSSIFQRVEGKVCFLSYCEAFYFLVSASSFNAAVRVGCGEVNSQVILFDVNSQVILFEKGLLQFVSIECAFTLWYPQKRETVKR